MLLDRTKLARVYDSLPPDAQHALVHDTLAGLLDDVAPSKAKTALRAASRIKARFDAVPSLNLADKRKEIDGLLDQLDRDDRRPKDASIADQLVPELVYSLTSWLSDIWRVVYEHNVSFLVAHHCLIFVINTIDQIGHGRSK